MDYTHEKPTVGGWYWLRDQREDAAEPREEVVLVSNSLVYSARGDAPIEVDDILPCCEWLGPLTSEMCRRP